MHRLNASIRGLVLAAVTTSAAFGQARAPAPVDFNRDIRPILSDNCFMCHGRDASHREAGLRLDTPEGARAALTGGGGHAIVPGKPEESVLLRRVRATDPNMRMPPPETGKRLSAAQIETLRRWIEDGSPYAKLWSLTTPKRPRMPAVSRTDWPRQDLDRFVLRRLDEEGLSPSEDADRRTLIRRVTLDLTGLPPAPEEIDAFLADQNSDAYERVVDRLLASPRYGEHMARFWLDAARYGDTHGLHLDNYREMWPFRDWVVGAFNANQPFDRFVTEQLAGDLLPDATEAQRIASGFNRCHITTNEGGSITEEVYVRNVIDRTSTAGTVFMGLTIGCATCHDHKFDPITQKEYYQLFAFFNSLDGKAMDGNAKAHPPVLRVPTEDQEAELARTTTELEELRKRLDAPLPEIDAAQVAWEKEWSPRLRELWQPLEVVDARSKNGATLSELEDGSVLATGENPARDVYELTLRTQQENVTAVRLDALTHESLVGRGPGRAVNGNAVLSEVRIEVRPTSSPDAAPTRLELIGARADHEQDKFPVSRAIDGKSGGNNGWGVDGHRRHEDRQLVLVPGKPFGFPGGTEVTVRLFFDTHHAGHTLGRVRLWTTNDTSLAPVTLGNWHELGPFPKKSGRAAFDQDHGPESAFDLKRRYGKRRWTKRPGYVDGKVRLLRGGVAATYLHRSIWSPSPRRISASLGSDDGIKVWLNGEEVLSKYVARGVAPDQEKINLELRPGENHLLMKIVNFGGGFGFYFKKMSDVAGPDFAVSKALVKPEEARSAEDRRRIRTYYRRNHSESWKRKNDRAVALEAKRRRIQNAFPTTLVYKELAKPRPAYLLERGQYDQRGEQVERVTPAALPPMSPDLPRNRLGFAKWLLAPEHPLTARVAVNRFWQQFFGTGLVETSEDFGTQGSPPSHPALLDWLAVEFRESGWDVKGFLRRLVTSRTYRQSSKVAPELLERDPKNRLLARGARFRLDAETLRDQALAFSGLLVEKLGGPGVKPPQPDGLWFAVGYSGSNTVRFRQDRGPDKVYRRSLYTFWKRTSPPPQMTTFDAPSREACSMRRERTNTPLQALLLMNDPQYVEAARALAQRILREGGSTAKERVGFGFSLVTGRPANPRELRALERAQAAHLEEFRARPGDAKKLIAVGETPPDTTLDAVELASWTLIANLLLNLDEVINKG